jgi:hypothetical protein
MNVTPERPSAGCSSGGGADVHSLMTPGAYAYACACVRVRVHVHVHVHVRVRAPILKFENIV